MFIPHGKKMLDDQLGYVADFCPICREVRAFRLLMRREWSASIAESGLQGVPPSSKEQSPSCLNESKSLFPTPSPTYTLSIVIGSV